jgi:hypothetical protein
MKRYDLDNAAKGKPWESVFRLLCLMHAGGPGLEVQTYTVDGKESDRVTLCVQDNELFSGLSPPPRKVFPRGCYLTPASPQYPAIDSIITGNPTLLLSMKVTISPADMLTASSTWVYGDVKTVNYANLKHTDGTTLAGRGHNLAEIWHEHSTGEFLRIRPDESKASSHDVPAVLPVKVLIISPRSMKEIRWSETVDGHWKHFRIVPVESLVRVFGKFNDGWVFQ